MSVHCDVFFFNLLSLSHVMTLKIRWKWFCVSFGINIWRILLITFYHFHKVEEFIVIINISLLPWTFKRKAVEFPIWKVSQKNQCSINTVAIGMRSGLMSCYLNHEQKFLLSLSLRETERDNKVKQLFNVVWV